MIESIIGPMWSVALQVVAAIVVLALLAGALRLSMGPNAAIWHLLTRPLEWPVRLLLTPIAFLGRYLPGTHAVLEHLLAPLGAERLQGMADRWFAEDTNDLRAGRLESHALRRWPKASYPQLWHVPEDLRRPLIVDGRLPDGSHPAHVLAPSYIDAELVSRAARIGLLTAVVWFLVIATLWTPTQWSVSAIQDEISGLQRGSVVGPVDPAELPHDVWSHSEATEVIAQGAALQNEIKAQRLRDAAGSGSSGWLTALLGALFLGLATMRSLIREAVSVAVEPLAKPTRDAVVRWKWRAEQRAFADSAYRAQLRVLEQFDRSPTLMLGRATGAFAFRGSINAPLPDQPMRLSLQDLAQHVLVLGGTGEGKTRSVLMPLARQLLALRAKMPADERRQLSVYGTDGKGVLWRDLKAAAIAERQDDDVVVIGCRTDQGEVGVDLLDGVDPQLVADIIRSVARQTGGQSTDSFWPDMAAEAIRNAATIARAWFNTADGVDYGCEQEHRVYSLVGIYTLVLSDDVLQRAVRAIRGALEQHEPAINDVAGPDLTYALEYMSTAWRDMAPQTKSGIVANVTTLLSPFSTNVALRRAFACGPQEENTLSIAQAWGKIVLVNVPSLEYGVAGRIVNVMLKTLLYSEARRRELADPTIGQREKLVFIADEFQDLVTADAAGLSDATFWNVARSAGVTGVIATQALASIEQAIGKTSTENLILQMRTKIILRSEDLGSLDFCRRLAGKVLRAQTFEQGHFESFAALCQERGNPIDAGPAWIHWDSMSVVRSIARAIVTIGAGVQRLTFRTWRPVHEVDTRFVPTDNTNHQATSAMQAAAWRAEDKNLAHVTQGNIESDIVTEADLMNMGRAHALMFVQRAGATRADIVRLS